MVFGFMVVSKNKLARARTKEKIKRRIRAQRNGEDKKKKTSPIF